MVLLSWVQARDVLDAMVKMLLAAGVRVEDVRIMVEDAIEDFPHLDIAPLEVEVGVADMRHVDG